MIYEMWINNHSLESEQAGARRTDAEREADMQAVIAAHLESGASVLMACDSGWADEQHPGWGITAFPNLEARLKQYQKMKDSGFFQLNNASFTLMGTAMEEPQLENIQPGQIYSLWVIRSDAAASAASNALSKEQQDEIFQKVESEFRRLGGCWIIRCNCYWANDAYHYFGVESFPSIEAFQEYKAVLEKLNWSMYVPGTSILGTLSPLQEQIKTIFG